MTKRKWIPWMSGLCLMALANGCGGLSYQDRGGGKRPEPLKGTPPPRFEKYRTPLSAQVLDRRFETGPAMYLASEMNQCGFPFFEGAAEAGLPTDSDFQYMTTVESYWYSRYNMSALVTESRLGIDVVHGPYVTEWALREGRANVNRDRAEYVRANKGVMLHEIIPLYLRRTGFPRRFEDASPCMLQFASGDPHYPRELDKGTAFESTENLLRDEELRKIYGKDLPERPQGAGVAGNDMWKARVNYRENFLTLRWDHDKMEHVIDLGAEGQTLMKQVLWTEYFFRGSHHGGRFLGNDPEEGFRGCSINLMEVSKMLMLKGTLLCDAKDGRSLGGADPREVAPGSRYFPHRVRVDMRMVGDLPPRPEAFIVEDSTSELFDQASLLWGLSEFHHYADPNHGTPWDWNKVFGSNTPWDGSVMERKYIVLAEALAHLVFRNMAAMHQRPEGPLVSAWRPGKGQGAGVSTRDLGMTLIALANYVRHLKAVAPDEIQKAQAMLRAQADFLIERLQRQDGAVADGYDFQAGAPSGGAPTLLAQGFAVRGLLEAYKVLDEMRYREAAERAYAFMNASLWDEALGVYRSQVGAERTVYTPMNLGAVISAMREIILLRKDAKELERFKRFWVQGVDSSGIQQSEYEETGERDFFQKDGDGDGIPRMEYAGGKYGIAPVYASRVEILTP